MEKNSLVCICHAEVQTIIGGKTGLCLLFVRFHYCFTLPAQTKVSIREIKKQTKTQDFFLYLFEFPVSNALFTDWFL